MPALEVRPAISTGILIAHKVTGQNVFFHLNHPIRWVRIAGIVVAIDEFPGRRIYTLDDSSGTSIECVIHAPTPDAAVAAAAAVKVEAKPDTAEARQWKGSASTSAEIKTTIPADVDVGTLIEVKGGLTLFRGHKQIKILKVTILRSTEQEVAFWEKIMQFRQDVLDKQWNLKDKEVRRCRKGEERRR